MSDLNYNALTDEVMQLMFQLRPPHHHPGMSPNTDKHGQSEEQAPYTLPRDLLDASRGNIGMLGALSHLGGEATPGQLSTLMQLSKGRISNIVRYLEERGYVEKHPSKEDSRSIVVALTKKGHTLTDEHEKAMRNEVKRILELLGPRNAEDSLRILKRLVEILKERQNDPISEGCTS